VWAVILVKASDTLISSSKAKTTTLMVITSSFGALNWSICLHISSTVHEDQAKYKCQIGSDYPEPMALFDTWIKHYPAAATNGAITNYFQDNKKKVKTEKK